MYVCSRVLNVWIRTRMKIVYIYYTYIPCMYPDSKRVLYTKHLRSKTMTTFLFFIRNKWFVYELFAWKNCQYYSVLCKKCITWLLNELIVLWRHVWRLCAKKINFYFHTRMHLFTPFCENKKWYLTS